MSWYDPTSWNVDWFGGNSTQKPSTNYAHQGQIEDTITQGLSSTANRAAPQVSMPQGQQPQEQWRGLQMQQANQLAGIASGQQQGAGEMAARRAAQAASAQQVGLANMQRGGAAPGAGLAAARNMVNIGAAGAGQAQQAALQDQQAAQGLLTGALSQGRGGDFQQAQLNQQVQLANLDAQLRQTGMNDQARLQYLAQLTGMDANQLQASLVQYQSDKQSPGLIGGLMNAGGQIGAAALMSDERLKTDITDARAEVDAMLDALGGPKGFKYKDEKFGAGRYLGGMAQDLERSEAGKRIVMETPEGKALDTQKLLSSLLATSARLNERLRKVEGKG